MKKSILLLIAIVSTTLAYSQAPDNMSYQSVIRDASGSLLANQAIAVKISILQSSTSGSVVFAERHTLTTNANGLASLEIGDGTLISGNFSTINWGSGTYFIKTETDPNGGTSYSISGTQQLLSVPYALHAKTADALSGGGQWTTSGNNIYKANSGNVGINVTNPSNPLTLSSTSNTEPLRIKGSNPEGRSILFEAFSGSNWELFNGSQGLNFCEAGVSCNRFTIQNGGNVGIGTSSPSQRLTVEGATRLSGGYVTMVVAPDNSLGNVGIGSTGYNDVKLDVTSNQAYGLFVDNSSASQYALYVNGSAAKPGGSSWTVASDAHLKKDVSTYSDGLSTVMSIKPVKFKYTKESGFNSEIEYVGVLAQDLQEVAPYMVSNFNNRYDGQDYLSVDNHAMTYMLINAVQEQQEIIDNLQKRLVQMEQAIEQLNEQE